MIKNLQIGGVYKFLEVHHDEVVGSKSMLVVYGLEWFHQDGVGVNVKVHHDGVVTAGGKNWEVAHVICVELDYGIHLDEYIF